MEHVSTFSLVWMNESVVFKRRVGCFLLHWDKSFSNKNVKVNAWRCKSIKLHNTSGTYNIFCTYNIDIYVMQRSYIVFDSIVNELEIIFFQIQETLFWQTIASIILIAIQEIDNSSCQSLLSEIIRVLKFDRYWKCTIYFLSRISVRK